MQQPPIKLPAGMSRCAKLHPCPDSERCARYLAPHEMGRPLEDFSTPQTLAGGCNSFLSHMSFRYTTIQAKQEPKPYMRGLT